jgi:hypothetical protein
VTGTGGTVTVSTKGSNIDTALFVYSGSLRAHKPPSRTTQCLAPGDTRPRGC